MTPAFPPLVDRALASIRRQTQAKPAIGIVLGSGLSDLAASFGGAMIPFTDIAGFPAPTVAGHAGQCWVNDQTAVMAGRFHYYEGHGMDTVVLPVAVLAALGVKTIILTNAAGSLNPQVGPGRLVLIRDHLNLMGANPLVGPADPRFGPRFPDMSEVYSSTWRAKARAIASALPEGVYLAVSGPSYETPAEIQAFRTLGADLVGMSTVPEAIVARSLGLEVLGISLVTNLAAGLGGVLDHAEVTAAGKAAASTLGALLHGLVRA